MSQTETPDERMEAAIETALRGGNPDDAARVIVSFRGCSLDAGRAEVQQRLRARTKG
ncbi:MAG TPA: hypothetical protein VH143_17795 [Kofleriaceae bacterium]|jgi:hypothetical protein|nr:hypothetical protein [Kofleriaceae bacterium]